MELPFAEKANLENHLLPAALAPTGGDNEREESCLGCLASGPRTCQQRMRKQWKKWKKKKKKERKAEQIFAQGHLNGPWAPEGQGGPRAWADGLGSL